MDDTTASCSRKRLRLLPAAVSFEPKAQNYPSDRSEMLAPSIEQVVTSTDYELFENREKVLRVKGAWHEIAAGTQPSSDCREIRRSLPLLSLSHLSYWA